MTKNRKRSRVGFSISSGWVTSCTDGIFHHALPTSQSINWIESTTASNQHGFRERERSIIIFPKKEGSRNKFSSLTTRCSSIS
jgi:hypothetical protein